MTQTKAAIPHWDLSTIYPGFDSPEFRRDFERLGDLIDRLEHFFEEKGVGRLQDAPTDAGPIAAVMSEALPLLNDAVLLATTLDSFVHGHVSTNSYDETASRRLSEVEQVEVRLRKSRIRFTSWVGSIARVLEDVFRISREARENRRILLDLVERSRYLMDPRLEDLAAELQLAGGGSMWKLQGNLTSQLKVPLERNGKTEHLPMTVVRNLAFDPDKSVRRSAYEAELKGWESVRQPVAFALNGVKGSAATLARWRGREDVLHASLEANRIDRETLEALMDAIREAFPLFRRYLTSKAGKLGKERLPWWDLFAPVGKVRPSYGWEEARDFIVEQFGRFDGEMAGFAATAFERSWIDAEPRDGKRGGAFCMSVPAREESRILSNFDGSFDQMITLAHELGHAFHNFCQRGLPALRRGAPMTLAETASIFCETIVFNAALDAADPDARVFILENQLLGATQVTVDISSRFLFESEVIRRRAGAEISADELCEIMLWAQKQTYGDALDPDHLHPYMWVMKPHYYEADLNFYNFPYAFGQLFGLGIYALYRSEGPAFVPRYKDLLRSTGAGPAADLASRFGIDIRSRDFWRTSLKVIEEQVELYESLPG